MPAKPQPRQVRACRITLRHCGVTASEEAVTLPADRAAEPYGNALSERIAMLFFAITFLGCTAVVLELFHRALDAAEPQFSPWETAQT